MIVRTRSVVRISVVTTSILLVPLVAMQLSEEWNWDPVDFLVMGSLLFGTGLAYEFVSSRVGAVAYRIAVGLALAAALTLIWVNAAVGIIGDGPVNVLYVAVLAVLAVGSVMARLKPKGMARALFATALTQLFIPFVALAIQVVDFAPGVPHVLALNSFFVLMFIGSGLLFRRVDTAGALAV